LIQPPLLREHRLYQADWLLRFYGFTAEEIATGTKAGHLDLELDPKLAWAIQHRGLFPLDVNRASRELLLRVPGFGTRTVDRIIVARRNSCLRYDGLVRIGANMNKARPFIMAPGWSPGRLIDNVDLRARFASPAEQLRLL
ncbi:radical SAM protein, partial [Brucella pecoris]